MKEKADNRICRIITTPFIPKWFPQNKKHVEAGKMCALFHYSNIRIGLHYSRNANTMWTGRIRYSDTVLPQQLNSRGDIFTII